LDDIIADSNRRIDEHDGEVTPNLTLWNKCRFLSREQILFKLTKCKAFSDTDL